MFNKLKSIVGILLLPVLLASCGSDLPIPDLDPNTQEGAEISLFEIGDTVWYVLGYTDTPQSPNIQRTYDFDMDGLNDMEFTHMAHSDNNGQNIESYYLGFMLEGIEQLGNGNNGLSFEPPEQQTRAVACLPPNALLGTTYYGVWTEAGVLNYAFFEEGRSSFNQPISAYKVVSAICQSLRYIPIRKILNGEYYYGWIEVYHSSSDDNYNTNDRFFIISRVGISQTPGLRVRMGQY